MEREEIKQIIKKIFPKSKDSLIEKIFKFSQYTKLNGGEKIIREGVKNHFSFFIISGSVKSYFLNQEGKRTCSWFAFENDFLTTTNTLYFKKSNETVELLEDSLFLKINTHKLVHLAETEISICLVFAKMVLEHTKFLEEYLYLRSISSFNRYQKLISLYPDILARVSLTDISSFLGIRRETLSRLRAQKTEQPKRVSQK